MDFLIQKQNRSGQGVTANDGNQKLPKEWRRFFPLPVTPFSAANVAPAAVICGLPTEGESGAGKVAQWVRHLLPCLMT